MKSASFKDLETAKKAAILGGVLFKRTKGKLSRDEIKTIIKKVNLQNQYSIFITANADEFGRLITLKDKKETHSWADSSGTQDGGISLIGEVTFGVDYYRKHSHNGDIQTPATNSISPDFDITKVAAVTIHREEWEKMNGVNEEWYYDYLIVYLPSGLSYNVDPVISKLIEAFDIA